MPALFPQYRPAGNSCLHLTPVALQAAAHCVTIRDAIGVTHLTDLVPLDSIASPAVEELLDRAFGPDRHLRTAYRVRHGTPPIAALSFAALDESGGLSGTIQCWPVALVCDSGPVVPMVMVGPVAVEPRLQQSGIGRQLMRHVLDLAESSTLPGTDALMLIGDPEYYARFFGFDAQSTQHWRLPGPFERHRLLARGSGVPDCAGDLVARPGVPA